MALERGLNASRHANIQPASDRVTNIAYLLSLGASPFLHQPRILSKYSLTFLSNYVYNNRIRSNETGEIFEDGQHILYVNSKKQDDTELGRLMHDLHCKEADKMYSAILSARVHQLKETEEGVKTMCQELEEIYNEGKQSGELKAKRETTLSLIKMGMSVEQIAKAVKLSTETVQNWISES